MKIGIIGGGGYTAGELLRILSVHPEAEIGFVYSASQAGKKVYETHQDLLYLDLEFSSKVDEAEVLFLCQGHGKSKAFLENHKIAEDTTIIDLGNDFRIANDDWVYGLPELQRELIRKSKKIANPGCFATAIQLALLPMAKTKMIKEDLHISAITGSTGAGQKLQRTTHFTWRQNNVSVYKAFSHQHEAEVYQSIHQLDAGYQGKIRFLPYRGDFTRGIYASIYTKSDLDLSEIIDIFTEYYENHPFVVVTEQTIDLKRVVNTNYCYLEIHKHDDQVLIHSIIDNLVKGASGQAVQNMNLTKGLPESLGLTLKPIGY